MSKNKKGQEGGGFNWVVAMFILLLSFGAILWVLSSSSAKAAEKTQVDLCRVSNEIKVGVEHGTSEYVSTPRVCNTIDKTSGKEIVPTKNYPQKDEGVAKEVRDMLKNCWYMWLEGSEPNIFRLFPGEQQCRICYNFKIKDGLNMDLNGLAQVLNGPYFASDTSDRCDAPNGGYLRDNSKCEEFQLSPGERQPDTEEPKEEFIKKAGSEFCCRKDLINECYNKGGQCSESPSFPYVFEYSKWACPSEKTCYVKPDNMVTYMEYIVEANEVEGKPAGDFRVEDVSSTSEVPGDLYPQDKKYAISFISPSKDCGRWAWKCWDAKVDAFFYKLTPGPVETWGRHNVEGYTEDYTSQNPSILMMSSYEAAKSMRCEEE